MNPFFPCSESDLRMLKFVLSSGFCLIIEFFGGAVVYYSSSSGYIVKNFFIYHQYFSTRIFFYGI